MAEIVDLVHPEDDPALLQATFAEVMWPSFTREELPDRELLLEGLDGGCGLLSVAVEDGQPVGGALSSYEAVTRIGLLEYLAAHPARRSRGVGRLLLDHQARRWADWPVDVVLAEVRDPRHERGQDDRPEDRLRFYERFGARLVMAPWVQPSLRPGLDRVEGELLLAMHPPGVEVVDAAALALWARGYFEQSEGAVPDDVQCAAVLAGIEAAPTVAVRPIGALPELAPPPRRA